ncbi:MAG TPA: IclR family transcriptional regulator [Promineifilum sp.]|nr:IclR family transcriptional regulator [Promineifilum sp.]HRO89378.1 IclR family transcriptional regulator [Promineifilum sp.]HRQ12734.1 IclR family transcriptional regulator [Promineifilum sp.]
MSATTEPMAGTQSVRRAVAMLEAFTDERPSWTVSDLVEHTGLNRTTAYRLLTALESAEYVHRDPVGDSYRLGSGLIALGGRAQRAYTVRTIALPELEALATRSGETATLEIMHDGKMVTIEEIPGEYVTSGNQHIGSRWPIHATSTGKAMLAHLPMREVEVLLSESLPSLTEKTITSAAHLRAQLAKIRDDGYAVAAEELELGFVAVGAPLLDANGLPVAAISLGGTLTRMTAERIPQFGTEIRTAAARISHRLGYRQQSEPTNGTDEKQSHL